MSGELPLLTALRSAIVDEASALEGIGLRRDALVLNCIEPGTLAEATGLHTMAAVHVHAISVLCQPLRYARLSADEAGELTAVLRRLASALHATDELSQFYWHQTALASECLNRTAEIINLQ